LIRVLFPRAEVTNAMAAHALCWDKLAAARRLLERGVAMPETLITMDPDEARDFVRHHDQAILKEPRACGGHGHVVLFADQGGTIAGEMPGRRYLVELALSGVGRTLRHGVLTCPPPFYLQRLVTDVGRGGVLRPAQILRAYVVDGQIAFWAERRRDKIRRPADFIISAAFGARYHFVRAVSDAAETLARRAAEALGVRIGAIDLIRAGEQGPFVLEADTDGQHLVVDRSFKQLPDYREVFDLDRMIADVLLAPEEEIRTHTVGVERRRDHHRGRRRRTE
jgi:glutathione synthase/RimK-type ligase-like ATP-grasp enzyme